MWLVAIALCLSSVAGCEQLDVSQSYDLDEKRGGGESVAPGPIQALYITNYSNHWHDYRAQQAVLQAGIEQHVNVEFTLVGKDQEDALRLMSEPNFASGYDVVIYNMCFADDEDTERIDNVIAQTRDFGVPAVLLHCAMHSFRATSEHNRHNAHRLARLEEEWAELNPGRAFPYWWRFAGVDTVGHEWPRSVLADRVENGHPITTWLPETLHSRQEELYTNLGSVEGVTPLYTAYSSEDRRDHLMAWTHTVGAGRVFATTLGHSYETNDDLWYQKLIAHGIAHVTGTLEEYGWPKDGYKGIEAVDNYRGR